MWRSLQPILLSVPCLLCACTAGLGSSQSARTAQQERDAAARLQMQTMLLRSEVDNLRAALLERDRREAELWQGYMTLMVRVNQLMEQQLARAPSATAGFEAELPVVPTQATRPVAIRALVRTIDRLNLSPDQKQSLIQLLSPPRVIDGANPWRSDRDW